MNQLFKRFSEKNYYLLFGLLLLLSLCPHSADCYKLNVPKVLLPHRIAIPVNFTLEITDPSSGCFIWKSSRPEVASVTGVVRSEDEDGELSELTDVDGDGNVDAGECSDRAIVSAVSTSSSKQSTIIFATERDGKASLRCDVMVDEIANIDIITTTREVFLEDSPEEFTVRALNDQGDTFTELGGVTFDWQIQSDTKNEVLKLLPFSESKYGTPDAIEMLERQGKQGHVILMEGVNTGKAQLTVTLRDIHENSVKPTTIDVMVIANLILDPPNDVYLPVHSVMPYRVLQIKQGSTEEVSMPCDQYKLELDGESVGVLDQSTSTVTALSKGTTTISLRDTNLGTLSIHSPSAKIHVSSPGSIHFTVSPGREWVLERGRTYRIQLELLDENTHRMTITDNMRMEVALDRDYLKMISQSENGSFIVAEAIKSGHTHLHATFKSIIKEDGREMKVEPTISGEQGVEITEPLSVSPPLVVFPWTPMNTGRYQYRLKAAGGTGHYLWHSENRKIATITETSGTLTILNEGSCGIVVSDAGNGLNKARARIYVTPPTRISFSPGPVEQEIGKSLVVNVAAYGQVRDSVGSIKEVEFTDCTKMSMEMSISDNGIFDQDLSYIPIIPTIGRGCRTLKFNARSSGDVKLIGTYRTGSGNVLEAEGTISAYPPLKIVSPKSTPLLVPKASWGVQISGGPRAWVHDPAHFYSMIVDKDGKAQSNSEGDNFFRIHCPNVGPNEPEDLALNVRVGNEPSTTNPFPAEALADLPICCKNVNSIKIKPDVEMERCPIRHGQPFPVSSKGTFKLRADVFGLCEGRQQTFSNLSSVRLVWNTDNADLAELPTLRKPSLQSGKLKYSYEVKTKGNPGPVEFSVTTSDVSVLDRLFFLQGSKNVDGKIQVVLTEEGYLATDALALFNHPSNQDSVQIHKGSGYFKLRSSSPSFLSAEINSQHQIQISPKRNGDTEIEVEDLCLAAKSPMKLDVSVSDIHGIEINGPNLIEVGKSVRLSIRVLDDSGRQLSSKYFPLLNIRPSTQPHIAAILDAKAGSSGSADVLTYIVKGVGVGKVGWTVEGTRADGTLIVSSSHPVQVFSPLRLYPKHVTLVPTSFFQIDITGGPSPRPNVIFSVNDTSVVKMGGKESSLLETLKIGHVKVSGKIVGPNGVLLSEDFVYVHVVQLTGIQIRVPITTMEAGTEIPVLGVGRGGTANSPFQFSGATKDPIEFEWSVDASDSSSVLHSPYVGLVESPSNSFSRRFSPVQPGKYRISLKASTNNHALFAGGISSFTDSVVVDVIDSLQIVSPIDEIPSYLLMTPNTQSKLSFNKPKRNIKLELLKENASENGSHGVVSIDRDGQLVSGSQIGSAALRITQREHGKTVASRTLHIEVAEVAYIMINSVSELEKLSNPLSNLPVKSKWKLDASFHDNLGRTFHATNSKVLFMANRLDLIDIRQFAENEQLHLDLKRSGITSLKVWDEENVKLSDYIRVPVGPSIVTENDDQLSIGSIVCLSSPLSGSYSSNDGSVLDDEEGIVVVDRLVDNLAVTSLTNQKAVQTQFSAAVHPAKSINFGDETKEYLSNVPDFNHTFFLTIQYSSKKISSNVHGCDSDLLSKVRVPAENVFECTLEWTQSHNLPPIQNIFIARPLFDVDREKYGCAVSSLPFAPQFSDIDSSIKVVASITKSKGIVGEKVVKFYPGFQILSSEVLLNDQDQKKSSVHISASSNLLQDIQAEIVPRWNVIKIKDFERVDSQLKLPLELNERSQALWLSNSGGDVNEMKIRIWSDITGQDHTIPIKIRLYGAPPTKIFDNEHVLKQYLDQYSSGIFVLVAIIATVLSVFLGYRCILGSGPTNAGNTSLALASSNHHSAEFMKWRSFGGNIRATSSPIPNHENQQPMRSDSYLSSDTSLLNNNRSGGSPNGSPYLWSRDTGRTPPNWASPAPQ